MRTLFALLFTASALLLSTTGLHAQFPQTLTVNATSPAYVYSASTKQGYQYTITVTGTYSMWPPYNAYGVDADYVYDVPQSEISAFRWPPALLYPLPHWVGDTIQIPNLFNTRDNIGFRINGEPLPNTGYTTQHRYQVTVMGTGQPIAFQILDSAFSIQQGKIIPRYEDNSGALSVLVQERPVLDICDIRTLCSPTSPAKLVVDASLLSYSADTSTRPKNILGNVAQVSFTIDGKPVRADSIQCGASPDSTAYALVLDRSGSMNFTYSGNQTRMAALKIAALNFLKTLKPRDQVMLITFSDSNDITVNQTWTRDTAVLGARIRAIVANGGTAYYDATWTALNAAHLQYIPKRAVVLLTDGDDNESIHSSGSVILKAQTYNIPVYTIGVALVDSSQRPLKTLAANTNGKFFQAKDQAAMDSAFKTVTTDLTSDKCCSIYLTLPRMDTGNKVLVMTAYDQTNAPVVDTLKFHLSDSCHVFAGISDRTDAAYSGSAAISLAPNPANDAAMATVTLTKSGNVSVVIASSDGSITELLVHDRLDAGTHKIPLDLSQFPPGAYFVQLAVNGVTVNSAKLAVQK